MNNRINQARCTKCDAELTLRIGLHNLRHGARVFLVQYFPIEMVVRENLSSRLNRHGNLAGGFDPEEDSENTKPFNYMDHIHVVLSMEKLVRYVLFREKLLIDHRAA